MLRSVKPLWFVSTMTVLAACGPMTVEPELSMTASPRTLDGNRQKSTLKLLATDDKSKPGTGSVRVTSTAGSMKDGEEVTLVAGEGTAEFGCDRATDINCAGTVKLTAEWVVSGKLNTTTTSVTITPPVVIVPDAGVSLTASRSQIGLGLGNTVDLVATYSVDGVVQAAAPLTFTTGLGSLKLPDGGAFSSPATTDSAGQVRAVLVESGVAGIANISAIGPRGTAGQASVTIYRPDAGLMITAQPPVLTVGFGEAALLTVTHTLENRAVTGWPLTLETTAGRLLQVDGGNFVSPAATDINGQVLAYLKDNGAPGVATITARDALANVQASTTVAFSAPDAGVIISASRQALYLDISDSVDVQAALYANGNPSPNRALNVATTRGVLVLGDGGVFNGMGTTDATGQLNLALKDNGTAGDAVLTATDPSSGRSGTTTVSIRQISTVSFDQMLCTGTPCAVLGINSSNFKTAGKLRFVVRDNQTPPQPVAGVGVSFAMTLSGATGTTLAPAQALTNASGVAEVTVSTGNAVGSFTVTATVLPGVAATSPSFGVRGAKATNQGFTIQCNRFALSTYTAPIPPLDITANCTVTVVDRLNNPVGLATDVSLRSEAGTISPTVQTLEFTASSPATEGKANVDFRTVGTFPAIDVPALVAAAQYPNPLAAEPSRMDGSRVRNPRDGLVVIIAWTRGEEWFNDLDGNGVQNGNEPFIDQGEPFIDTNDNDVFDGNDTSFNVDNDGVYTPPNGVWDANTFVWTKTYVLYTDRSEPSLTQFSPSMINVLQGMPQDFFVSMPDLNLNRVEAGSTVDFVRTATKGTVTTNFANLALDSFGFDFEPRTLTNQAGTAACPTVTDKICVFKTRFGQWGRGALGKLTISSPIEATPTPPQNESITVRTTTRSGQVQSLPLAGTIQ